MAHKPGHILGENEDSWNYVEVPTFRTIRGEVPYNKPIKLEDSTGFEDLQTQFDSAGNRTIFGQPKTVEQKVEDYNGLGPGRIIIKGKTNTPEGIFFYPDNTEYAKEAVKDISDYQNLEQAFQSLSILGGATATKARQNYNRPRQYQKMLETEKLNNIKPKNSKEQIMNEVFQIKDFTSGSIRKGGLFDPNAYGSLGPMYTSTQPNNLPTRSERLYDAILNDAPGMSYPTIEQVNFALKPKSKRAGEIYTRPEKTTKKQWDIIGKRLQNAYGGTDQELKAFIKRQKLARKQIEKEIAIENRLHQNNYLSAALDMIDNDMLAGVKDMEDLYGNKMAIQDVEDFVYLQAQKIKQNPSKANVMELGHVKAAKNIWDESKELTTADYESNMRSEMKRSIRDYSSSKGKPLKIIKRKDAKGRTIYEFKGGHVIEPGNIHRGHESDLPDIMNLFLGTMPSIEVEYMKYIGELGYAVAPQQVIPSPAHYESYIKKRWRKWQGLGDTKVHGKQQLELFYKKINQYTDDYLNALEEGKFLSNKAGSDAIDDMLKDKRTGVHQKRQSEAEQRAIKRKIETMEDIIPDE